MRAYIFTFVAALITHTSAVVFNPIITDIVNTGSSLATAAQNAAKVNATCKTTDGFPTESQYDIGVEAFCNKYVSVESKLSGGRHRIDEPALATFDLRTYHDKLVRWVYRIDWAGPKPAGYMTNLECKTRFKALYTTNRAGGLGTTYCIVAGTIAADVLEGKGGNEGMSGEGAVVILGGTFDGRAVYDHEADEGWFSYEAYERAHNG